VSSGNDVEKVAAAVAIGRNEGERLQRCLESIPRSIGRTVYVDSGSTDGSVDLARRHGAEVVELDVRTPFTAARARNAGIARASELAGGALAFVLVLDGDCELASGFFERALSTMKSDPRVAVVCGRRRERHRDASIYNTLCDMEWDTPVGDAESCGGDALIRMSALREAGGYDDGVIAGEEPELCLRLRGRGWLVRRIDGEMTLHDAAMARFSQWWKRAVRAGHAYAELYARHRYWGHEVRSILVSALAVPTLAFAAAPATGGLSLGLLAVHGLVYRRARTYRTARGDTPKDAALYARFCVVAKFAQLAGMARYVANRALGRRSEIIEYKPRTGGSTVG
jgi:GT2 family glycosyltransferase